MLVAYLFFLFFSLRFPHSHGHTTYPRRRSSSASWWRPTSSQTWPTVSEFTPTYSLLLRFPKDYKTGSWETDRKEPLDSGWPEHCRGFHIKGDLFFFLKIQEVFCGEMHTCAFRTKDSSWSKQGMGGHGEDLSRGGRRKALQPHASMLTPHPTALLTYTCQDFAELAGQLDEGT